MIDGDSDDDAKLEKIEDTIHQIDTALNLFSSEKGKCETEKRQILEKKSKADAKSVVHFAKVMKKIVTIIALQIFFLISV